MTISKFWQNFLDCTNKDNKTKYIDCFHFELTEKLANKLLSLVISGAKQATSSSLLAYEITGDKMPQIGDYSIVTDWDGNPNCIIQTTNITIIPFKEMTFDICKREGEDNTLESWQIGHKKFFINDAKQLGYEFTEDMPVLFEDFKVVFNTNRNT